MSKVTISDDAHALAVYVSIGGRKTSSEELENNKVDQTQTIERRTEEVIANVEQYEKAKTLAGRLRAAVARHSTNVEPLGNLTDSKGVAAFRETVAEILTAIDAHNAEPMQQHRIKRDVLILPVGRIFDESTQQRLCSMVAEELTNARTMLKAGDAKGLGAWLAHRKNLSALMPAMVQRVIDLAMTQLTEQRKRVMKLMKGDESLNVPARTATEAGALAEVDDVDAALTWVEVSQTGVSESSGHTVQ